MGDSNHVGLAVADMLGQHQKRIDLVRQCANEARESEFERKWLSVLRRCAEWFSSLPLTPELHREPGGAFRATIETGFYAMRLAGGQKFAADLTSEARRRLEPQYNYAVFLAAVCSALDEPCRHFEFTRMADHTHWNPAAHGAFGPWIGVGKYAVDRLVTPMKPERMRTAIFAQSIITQDLLAELDGPVLSELFGAINPERIPLGVEALVHKVVRKAIDVSVDFERKAQKGVFAPVKFDVPSAVHVALELQPEIVPAPQVPQPAAAPVGAAQEQRTSQHAQPAPQETPSPTATTAPSGAGPKLSQSLLDALQESESIAASPRSAANQSGMFVRPVDPSTLSVGPQEKNPPSSKHEGPTNEEFEEVLGSGSTLLREFFRALAGDVAEGKAKIEWDDKGLVLQKRLVGGYGVTSDTLIEQLKKRSLLLRAHGNEICIIERAGRLIQERPTA